MTRVIFTADTHFGQQRTLELSRRPFYSVESMTDQLVSNWNLVVDSDDEVYHLGDFGDPEVIEQLNGGRIFLLPGNYDDEDVLWRLQQDPRVGLLDQPYQLLLPPEYDLPTIHLIHEPERGTDPNAFYLFGHIHRLQMVKRNGLNVGVDCHDFYPIDLETVKFYHDAITKHYDENVFLERIGA